jgi:hypothetical protein
MCTSSGDGVCSAAEEIDFLKQKESFSETKDG